jgi:peptidoglycan L-alanyl-D-glutamate endopeptidase CwlK
MINSRKIEDLHPKVAELCNEFIKKCNEAGYKVLITSTYRDAEYQNDLYAQGRTKPGKIVTKAKGGQSIHNWKCAFDFVPLDANGKADWNNTKAFEACGKIAKEVGLEWGGNWKFKDMPHCQFTNGLTLADFQAGKTL